MNLRDELAPIVGVEHVSDAPAVLEKYSKDYSFVDPRRPSCLIYPKNPQEIQNKRPGEDF